VNPYGLMSHEISASGLVKIDISGNIVDNGSTTYGVNRSQFVMHSAVYRARPDIKCILHVHTPSTQAVSMLKSGLLPLSNESIACGNVSYHEFKGILFLQILLIDIFIVVNTCALIDKKRRF
jgi:adducin